jgi:hypothetical protein
MRSCRPMAAALLAAALPLIADVQTPQSHFGHSMGADRKLLDWERVVSYFRLLQASSDRIRVEELGKTTEGRPLIAATIAAADTIRNLDRYREIQARLADPRRTTTADAEQLIEQGKTVVMITCSIHATEVASTSTAIEFAYKLLTDDNPKFQAILQDTILILVPSLNPDGLDIVTRWYRKTVGTPFEGTPPPELYHKYVGHDNNRDWYIFSQAETRLAVSKLHNVWHPQIVYDVHQQGAYASRMFVPPWMDPVDPNIDPIIAQLCNAIGAGMAADLTAAGKTGIAVNAMYDFWTPARHYQAYHGGLRILSESASVRIATPVTIKPEELSQTAPGYSPRERSWNHLEPWAGGDWRLRDIVDYQLIAMESCLFQSAVRRADMLRAFYAIGRRAVARKTPYAFIIGANQRDPGATSVLLDTLSFGQVLIERATTAFTAAGKKYEAGSHVIRMQQPYSSFAKTLLERQHYPDLRLYPGGPPKRPYDVTAHTLPLLMGVAVDVVEQPFTAVLTPAEAPAVNPAALASSDTDSWRTINAAWDAGVNVWRNSQSGDFLLARGDALELRRLRRPRVGLYKSYVPSMDEGWTRWTLENFGFKYTSVFNSDLQSSVLKQKFDVLVFPDQGVAEMHNGHRPGTMPDEFTGGIGTRGVEALKNFVIAGGTLIFLNNASDYAIQYLGVGVKDVLQGVPTRDFYAPGSLLNTRLETHPLTLGLPRDITIWFENSPTFEVSAASRDKAVATYPESGLLSSGWLLGEKHLAKRASLVDVSVGSGHIVLFGMRPQYRAQSYQTLKLFFNALLYFE